jgi:hypothetical protein
MADRTQRAAAAGESAGRTVGGALADVAGFATKTAARTREEVEDVFADAKAVADSDAGGVTGREAATYVGLAATAALGVVDWPLAAALGVGYAVVRRARYQVRSS